jgi:hypothetical protein
VNIDRVVGDRIVEHGGAANMLALYWRSERSKW